MEKLGGELRGFYDGSCIILDEGNRISQMGEGDMGL